MKLCDCRNRNIEVSFTDSVKDHIARQLAAALEMLTTAIENSSDSIWTEGSPPFWQVSFHIVNSVDFYLSTFNPELSNPVEAYRLPKEMQHHANKGFFDNTNVEQVPRPDLLSFLTSTRRRIREYFGSDIESQFDESSGFPWLSMDKYELLLYNMRHIMEHVAILNQQLKLHGLQAADWVGISEL